MLEVPALTYACPMNDLSVSPVAWCNEVRKNMDIFIIKVHAADKKTLLLITFVFKYNIFKLYNK